MLKINDRVSWTYFHSLNSRSGLNRTKHGTIKNYCIRNRQYIMVKFDGNKTSSKVLKSELVKIEKESKRNVI